MSQLDAQYANRNKIKNDQYGDELRDYYLDNEPIPGKEEEYQIMKQLIDMPVLNIDVANEYAKELISDNDSNFVAFIYAQEKAGKVYPTEDKMAQTIKAVRAEKIEPYVDNVKSEPILDEKNCQRQERLSRKPRTKLSATRNSH